MKIIAMYGNGESGVSIEERDLCDDRKEYYLRAEYGGEININECHTKTFDNIKNAMKEFYSIVGNQIYRSMEYDVDFHKEVFDEFEKLFKS